MTDSILLVRHTAVALAWTGRCYGVSDVPLSRDGKAAATALSAELIARQPIWVMHSGLARTRILAARIAAAAGCPLLEDPGWRERNFGTWEGQTWQAIYRATGNAMDGMIAAPADFRPGGGETTCELADRVTAAWQRLPSGAGIVVTHGGPIAALLGSKRNAPVAAWPGLVPAYGEAVILRREQAAAEIEAITVDR